MKLGPKANTINCEVNGMQTKMHEWLHQADIAAYTSEHYVYYSNAKAKIALQRRADFLVLNREGRLINIEAKCNDLQEVIHQLDDHAYYCDYCFALIPDYAVTPLHFKHNLLKKGYGLIVYNYQTQAITEALEAHYNKPTLKTLRTRIKQEIRSQRIQKNAPPPLDL